MILHDINPFQWVPLAVWLVVLVSRFVRTMFYIVAIKFELIPSEQYELDELANRVFPALLNSVAVGLTLSVVLSPNTWVTSIVLGLTLLFYLLVWTLYSTRKVDSNDNVQVFFEKYVPRFMLLVGALNLLTTLTGWEAAHIVYLISLIDAIVLLLLQAASHRWWSVSRIVERFMTKIKAIAQ